MKLACVWTENRYVARRQLLHRKLTRSTQRLTSIQKFFDGQVSAFDVYVVVPSVR